MLLFHAVYFTDEIFQTRPEETDGLELAILTFRMLPLAIAGVIPCLLFGIHNNLPFFRYFNSGNLGVTVLFVISMFYMHTVDWIVVGTMNSMVLLQTNGTTLCLQKMIKSRFVDALVQINSKMFWH